MIRYQSQNQISIEEFQTPFQLKLNSQNRWIKLSRILPWDELASIYYQAMSTDQGRPSIDARRIIGAMIIKHKLVLSDEETVMQIQENVYLQYFLGYSNYEESPVFSPTLFVEIRKRIGTEKFNEMSTVLINTALKVENADMKKRKRIKKGISTNEGEEQEENREDSVREEGKGNNGKMLLDATVAEQAIKYPNDLDLLNDCRKASEELIDMLFKKTDLTNIPRTYRREARKAYLSTAKKKNKSRKEMRKAIGKQLRYLRRNLKHIEKLLDTLGTGSFPLGAKYQRKYWIIQEIYRQQTYMHENNVHSCNDRIVSLSQPHVRPIVRGKTGKKTEFGSKIGVSMKDGFAIVDNLSWDAYNESADLAEQVENYRKRNGCYPETVIADNIYGNQKNREYMNSKQIQFSGKPLGRPKKETEENKEQLYKEKEQRKKQYRERIPIEGKFGQGKNGYRLNYIRAKLPETSESWISCIFFVMNLMNLISKKINSTLNYLYTLIQILNPEIITHKNNLLPIEKRPYLSSAFS
jgi:transposase, IS5 family